MERTKICLIFEAPDQDKFTFSITRKQATKSEFLTKIICSDKSKDKDIKNVRLKINCPASVFTPFKTYFSFTNEHTVLNNDNMKHDLSILQQWELDWLKTLDSMYIIDTLVIASHLKMIYLCKLIYFYLQNESVSQKDSDFKEKFSIVENEELESSLLTDTERIRLGELNT